jgi:hypothetical protein
MVEAIQQVVVRRTGQKPRLTAFPLGPEPHTPLGVAVEATLAGLGCLAASASSEARALA